VLNELTVPPQARSDKNAQEMVRAWVVNGGLQCSLNVDSKGDQEPIFWGILLTDIVRHVANAMRDARGWNAQETITEIRRVFNAELDDPTAEASGYFNTH
jgi:Domain of unknown function (DUF5076)